MTNQLVNQKCSHKGEDGLASYEGAWRIEIQSDSKVTYTPYFTCYFCREEIDLKK